MGRWTLASCPLEFKAQILNLLLTSLMALSKTLAFLSVLQLLNEANDALTPRRNVVKYTS